MVFVVRDTFSDFMIVSAGGIAGAVSTPSLGVHKMQIGNLILEVSSGDITKERCDAIINSSNQSFSLKSGKVILYTSRSCYDKNDMKIGILNANPTHLRKFTKKKNHFV